MENKIGKNKIAFNMFSRLSEDIRDYIALYESYDLAAGKPTSSDVG